MMQYASLMEGLCNGKVISFGVDRTRFPCGMCLWMARRCETRSVLVERGCAYDLCDVLILRVLGRGCAARVGRGDRLQ